MESVVEKFYSNFKLKNGDQMASCYHENVVFEDPAFGELKGKDAGDMWRMLCENGKDMRMEYDIISDDGVNAEVHWQAWYTFSQTGNKVHNIICAKLKIKDGLIIDHRDDFSTHRWASQAMGWKGWLLGKTGFFQKKLQQQTNKLLRAYQKNQ